MKKFVALSLAMLVATILSTLALAPPAVASDPTFSFNFVGPQAAKDDGTGHTIHVTGSGSFDPSDSTVVASGAFAITNSFGAVVSHGTWKATAFGSFCSRGGPSPGFQGGVLHITVTLFPEGGDPIPGVSMTVTCRLGTGCSAGKEGVTVTGSVGSFTDVVRGATLFHLNE